MKNLFILMLLVAATMFSCQKEPCEDLFGAVKVSCVQCEEFGSSNYVRIVEKPAGFPPVPIDSLFQYGRDRWAYLGGTATYEIAYGQDQCPGNDINGYIYINHNSSIRSDLHSDIISVGEFYSKLSNKFRYRVFPDGTIREL